MSALPLISALTEAFYKPQLNAVGIDKDGNYVDKDGKPTSLYTAPGMWQKAFNPYANQINQQNLAASAAPLEAMRQRALGRSLGMADYNTLTPEQQALYPNPENALTTSGNNFTAQNMESAGNSLADIHNGVPMARAIANRNMLSASAAEGSNAATKAAMAGLLGTPSTEALNENQGAQNQLSVGQGESALIPTELYNKGLGLSNNSTQLLGQRAALPYQNDELLNTSRIGAATSGQGVTDLPYTLTGQRAGDIGATYAALHPSIYGSQFNANIDPSRGTIIPGRAVSPEMRSAAALGMLPEGFGGGGSTMTLGSGRTIVVPPQAIDPLAGGYNNRNAALGQQRHEPPIGTAQNPDYNTDAITQHPVDEANHDAAQATIASQIAALKAKAKQLQATHTSRSFLNPSQKDILKMGFDSPLLHSTVPTPAPYTRTGLTADEYNRLLGAQ